MIDDIKDAKEQLEGYLDKGQTLKELVSDDDVYDKLHEIADSNVDVYNHDLLKWVVGNYSHVEDAISEFGHATDSEGKPDFMLQLRQGQYQANIEVLNEAVEDLLEGK